MSLLTETVTTSETTPPLYVRTGASC